jgi:hypothetical protein
MAKLDDPSTIARPGVTCSWPALPEKLLPCSGMSWAPGRERGPAGGGSERSREGAGEGFARAAAGEGASLLKYELGSRR